MMGVITHRYYDYTFTCTSGGECVRVYLVGMLVLLSLNIVLLVALINRSAQGGICDVHARRMVPPLLGAKLLLLLPEAGWNGLGTVWAFTSVITCPDDHFTNTAIDVLVCLDWVLFALLVFALAMVIDPIGSVKLRASQPDLTLDTLKNRQVTRTWIRRFRWFFCWLNRDKESLEAFAQVAGLFSSLFRDSDLVPSDLIAGCVLLRVKQKRESREQWRLEIMAEQRLKYKSDLREVFRGKPVWLSFDKAEHYMKLSMATYGCTFVMYRYCCTGICRLLRHTTCCACFRPKKVMVEGDNCCMCNMAGFKELADMTEDEIIYANFKNRIFEVPFCIISDHKTKSIVLTLRGSISLRDVFTDLVACPEKIDLEGLPEGSMAHKGMLITAKKLKTHLDETKTLDKALSLYPHYDLVITGHSLGAAAAVLLGILYKPIYPELKVYAFSTPCVITRAAAIYCESFVFTIGVGDDFAMRISVETIENLRAQLFEALQNCRLPKYRVIVNGFGYALFGVPSKHLNTTWRDDRPTPHHSVLLPAPNAVPYMFAPSTANSIEVFSSSLRQNCKETDPNYSKNKVQEIPHFWKTRAHKGMLITAKKLKTHLDETKTLDKALSLYPHYDLVITGHSLGAAAAVLLGILYKPIYPELKVYAFSTPCVITRAAAIYCESFVFTIGVGDDFAMRISVETIENLRAQLFEALQNCRLPKYRVIVNGFGYALFGVPSKHLNTTWRDDRPTPHHSVLLPAPNAVPYMFAPSTANSIEVFSSSLRQNCKETDPNYSKNKVQEIPHFWKTRDPYSDNFTRDPHNHWETRFEVGSWLTRKEDQRIKETVGKKIMGQRVVHSSCGPDNVVITSELFRKQPKFLKLEVATRKYTNVSLYPAGNILHIVHKKKSKEEKSRWHCLQLSCCKKKRRADEKTYEMRWLSPDSFDELRVMPRMLLDHLPENVYKVLTTILDEQETEIEDNVEFIM
ncbi:hypothetical protein J6590_051405 [Homalodisca vitripennis]|nr:hypothetical protein J6590_051405 [Homalodisca vitripennis]